MTYYVCPKGLGDSVRAQAKDVEDVIELIPLRARLPQLLKIPEGADVMPAPDSRWSPADKNRFSLMVIETCMGIALDRNTFREYRDAWATNALLNHDAAMRAYPVNTLPKTGDCAVVIGSGPSAKGYSTTAQAFCAWSAMKNIAAGFRPSVICHCDHRDQGIEAIGSWMVFTPYCSPRFLRDVNATRFVYLDAGNPYAAIFAAKRDIEEHNKIAGNVVDMMVNCAIYAGHTKIKCIGVDLCFDSPEGFQNYRPTTTLVVASNYRGEVVYTDEVFLTYKRGLEEFPRRYPEIEFTNASDKGLILEGWPYEP